VSELALQAALERALIREELCVSSKVAAARIERAAPGAGACKVVGEEGWCAKVVAKRGNSNKHYSGWGAGDRAGITVAEIIELRISYVSVTGRCCGVYCSGGYRGVFGRGGTGGRMQVTDM
jgi:hypothetical protein